VDADNHVGRRKRAIAGSVWLDLTFYDGHGAVPFFSM